uniref:Polyketide synthase dehydratase domain-containing protein n=1 Tax=Pyrodinium bahamense TaxID=73915 RepID=A0A7S0FEV2_9DINO|mmetsp:Transcript_26899/g.73994  ORF Transcript_26899/g.73994 Transcript_26899/m.73994 type:complete len:270 (+) Transcript_26899:77-886(+)
MSVSVPDSLLSLGTPEGVSATVSLPEDAWDMLGLGVSDAMNEKQMQVLNGQVALMTGADYFASKKDFESEQREAYRQQWQYEAEQRLARIEAKKSPLERAGEGGMMKSQKFAWSKDGQKSFEWRKIYHALAPGVGGMPDGGLITETVISPTAMRMYTDHRVMGAVVLPGVSHVSLMAATGSIGFPSPGGLANDWHMSIKETLFERPYIVNSGAELIAAISAGMDPSQVGGGGGGMQAAMLPVGVPMTYCRATGVSKERGQIKPTSDWAK